MRRDPLRWLLLGLLVVMVAGCGGATLPQDEETLTGLEAQNQALQEALAKAQGENQQLQDALAQAQGDNRQIQGALAQAQDENQQLQDALAQAQGENQQIEQTLADAEAEIERLREALNQTGPDLSWVPESLWLLFHDDTPALWACDDTASRVVPQQEMPSASPEEMVQEINERFQTLNPALESPDLVMVRMEGDTAVVRLGRSNVVTEQMGSTGAQCYFASVTFSLTSFESIDHVRFDIEEGNHGGPGRYDRADFVHYLPLESGQP